MNQIRQECGQAMPQWQKVYGILENAIYGGRVDNEFDIKVLRAYMMEFFTEATLKGQMKLSNIIQLPQSDKVDQYLGVIKNLPEKDMPSLFGLPANIDRSVQRFNSMKVIASLKSLQAVSAEEMRFDMEKWN